MAKKTAHNNADISGKQEKTQVVPAIQFRFSISEFRTQAIILALLGFIFYCNTFSHEAAFDDRMAITDNEYVQKGLSGIPDILTKDAYQSYLEHRNGSNQLAGGRYRPLSLITFAIEQQMLGVNSDEPTKAKDARVADDMHTRHFFNVLLYILSSIVLLRFLRKIVFPSNALAAFAAALIFVVLPAHTEVVANVKSRDEILSLLFICLTFVKAFRYRETKKTTDLVLALICYFLALLSKEYAVTLVALLPLSFYLFAREPANKSIKSILPYLIPLAIYLLLRFNAVTAVPEGAENSVMNNPYLYATGVQKIATRLLVLLYYIRLLIFPTVLTADYSYNQIPYTDFTNPQVWCAALIYLGLVVALVLFFLRRHVLCFGIAFYLLNILLISNLFFNIGAPMGERLIYHASLGFAIVAGYVLVAAAEKMRTPETSQTAVMVCLTAITILSGFKTISRNADWKNDETLFTADVKTAPNSVLANNNAAAACMSEAKKNISDTATRNDWLKKAVGYYDKALAIYPMHTLARLNRGLCYFNMGFPDRAMPDWDTVRKYRPDEPNLSKYLTTAGNFYYNTGSRYEKENRLDSAVVEYKKCIEAVPDLADGWYFLGRAYLENGNREEAQRNLARAIQIAPNFADAKRLYAQATAGDTK